MKIKLIHTFFAFLFCFSLLGQNKSIDSLLNEVKIKKHDTMFLKDYFNLFMEYRFDSQYDNALLVANNLQSKFSDEELGTKNCEIYLMKGLIFKLKNNIDSSIYCLTKAEACGIAKNYDAAIFGSYGLFGQIYESQRDYSNAINYFNKAFLAHANSKDSVIKWNACFSAMSIADLFVNLNQYQKALEYAEQGYAIVAHCKKDGFIIPNITKLAQIHFKLGNYSKAEAYCKTVITYFNNGYYKSYAAGAYILLGDIATKNALLINALDNYEKSFAITNTLPLSNRLETLLKISSTHLALNNTALAEKYCKIILDSAVLPPLLKYKVKALKIWSDCYLKKGNYKEAYKFLALHKNFADSLLDIEKIKEINLLEKQFQVGQKNKEITSLQVENFKSNESLRAKNIFLWLSGLILLIAAIAIYNIIKNYKKNTIISKQEKQLALKNERERIITDLHDDVGATLSSMFIYSDLAQHVWDKEPEKSKEMVVKLNEQSKDLMQRMNDIVWSIKTNEDQIGNLTNKILNYTQQLLSVKNIITIFNIDENLAAKIVNPTARKNMLLIAKEAINNVSKYSNATEVVISLATIDNAVNFTIADNGNGFDLNVQQLGNGLDNMKKRAANLKGKLVIDTQIKMGTTIRCTIPIATISYNN